MQNASLHIPFEFDGSCLSTIHDISLGRLWRYDGLNDSFRETGTNARKKNYYFLTETRDTTVPRYHTSQLIET